MHKLKNAKPFSKPQLAIFVIVFALIGYLIFRSFAINPNLPGDLNNDNTVNITDLSILLSDYGATDPTKIAQADINGDGAVNVLDMSVLLSHYGQTATLSKPTAPTGLTVTAGDTKVTLTWNANPSTEQVDVYQVYLNGANYNLSVTGTTFTVTGLTNSTSYSFRVGAHNSAGYGPWTDPAISATPQATTGGGTPGTHQWFADNSPWNILIQSGYPSASNSSTLISRIVNSGYGVGVNQGSWTPVVFYAPAGTPRYKAVNPDGWIVDDVPIPSNYVTPIDSPTYSDSMVVIVDQALGRIYNIPKLAKTSTGGWTFGSAGIFNPKGSGWWDGTLGPWSGRAANSSLLGGLVTPEDFKAGVINHALAVALPSSINAQGNVSPALTYDGVSACTSTCVPEGSWLQLDPSLSDSQLLSLGFTQGELILAHAMQRYGIFDVDSTNGSISFYAQSTKSPGGSTYGYPSDWSDGINRGFLSHLRVLQPPPAPVYDSRNTYGEPHK
jgi:hypothetical protein